MEEIAIRALSPGINDPNTAIHILKYMAILDSKFAKVEGEYALLSNFDGEDNQNLIRDNQGIVIYRFINFPYDVHQSYATLIHYIKEDISTVKVMFQAIYTMTINSVPKKMTFLKEFGKYLYNLTYENYSQEWDKKII